MTKIKFTRKNGRFVAFKLSGHTGKAEAGSDVLCSAISTASQMAVLAITEVAGIDADVQIRDGFLSLALENPTTEADLIITSLYKTLADICGDEKKYVKLEVEDV